MLRSSCYSCVVDLAQRVASLKHDLGKYCAWMSANLDDADWAPPISDRLIEALQRDLLATRTRRDGSEEPAWEVWKRLAGDLDRPLDIDELAEVEKAVSVLAQAEPALREGNRDELEPQAADLRAAQQSIRQQLKVLARRIR